MMSDGSLTYTVDLLEARNFDGGRQGRSQSHDRVNEGCLSHKNDVEPHYSPLATISSNVHKQHSDSAFSRNTNAKLYH